MELPPLLNFSSEADYRKYFIDNFVEAKILTFDGILVKFYPHRFDDAFFESISRSARDKARFSQIRAQRMNWISAVLNDRQAELYRWTEKGSLRRIALHSTECYAVIIAFTDKDPLVAKFVTAYVADNPKTLANMRSNPKW